MLKNNYDIGMMINEIVKYNIDYDLNQIVNYVCVNYINTLLDSEQSLYLTIYDKNKLQSIINKLQK